MTGFVFAAQETRSQIRSDALVPLGTVLVMGLAWVDMRSVRRTLPAAVPVVVPIPGTTGSPVATVLPAPCALIPSPSSPQER